MLFFKKILIVIIVLGAMYMAYAVTRFLKRRIHTRRNVPAFLLLLVLTFACVFAIILGVGWVFSACRDFFFRQ